MDVDTSVVENLLAFKDFLQRRAQSASPIWETQDAQRLKDGVDFLFSMDSQHDSEKFECISFILTVEPSVLKPKLNDLVRLALSKGTDRTAFSLIIDSFKAYSRMRKIVDFLKVYISSIVESETVFVGSEEELRCLESIFVDVSHSQCVEIIHLFVSNLEKLLATDSEEKWKTGVKICLMLRAVTFSSPALIQHRETAEKLINDLAELMKKSKSKVEYRRVVADIVMEVMVKMYLAMSTYEKFESIDLDILLRSFPKKSIGLPWKLLLSASDQASESQKFQRLITKYIDLGTDHDCGTGQDDLGVECLPGYCLIEEFWRKLLSNFSLFRHHVDQNTMEKIIQFIRLEQNPSLRSSIIDFLSVFDIDIDQSIAETDMEYEIVIPEEQRIENEEMEALKEKVIDAMEKHSESGEVLESILSTTRMISDPMEAVQQLQMAAFAFEQFETKPISDDVKMFFKEFSNRIFSIVPILISKNFGNDMAMTVKILTKSLDVFTAMIADKSIDLPKYPPISVALACTSMVPWDRISGDQRIHFRKSFDSFLKLLQTGMKKCNSLIITSAPNWMGILRRMQWKLFELSTESDAEMDDWTPTYRRLGRFYSTLDRSKELEKIALFIVLDLVDCLRKRKLSEGQKDALEGGVYRLIGISDSYSVNMMTAMMDDTAKELFRVLHDNYVKYYKYTGQV